jgi:outer membrane receptor protein involved in Fe transport
MAALLLSPLAEIPVDQYNITVAASPARVLPDFRHPRVERSRAILTLTVAAILWGSTAALSAQDPDPQPPTDLGRASLADLMNIQVTSAFRKEQRVMDTPAAVSIITSDEIRRSGATSIPEALRLAPGVQVARINGKPSRAGAARASRNRPWLRDLAAGHPERHP